MPASHQTLHGFQTAVIGSFLFVIGGFEGCSSTSKYCQATSKVSEFDARTNKWRRVADMVLPRGNFACAVVDGLLYVAGGESCTGSTMDYSGLQAADHEHNAEKRVATQRSAEVYNPSTGKWTSLPEMHYSKQLVVGTAANGKLSVSGFESQDYLQFEEVVEMYDPRQKRWVTADLEFLAGDSADDEIKKRNGVEGRRNKFWDLPAPLFGRMASFEFGDQEGSELFFLTDSMDIVRLKMGEKGEVCWGVTHRQMMGCTKRRGGPPLFCQIVGV